MSNNIIGENKNNTSKGVSPISKMKIITVERAKLQSKYWIEHFKYKQNLINQLSLIKNEKDEKTKKISEISSFSQEQEVLCDNLYKMRRIINFSRVKLEKNSNEMKSSESVEETRKKKLKEIFEKNLENIRNIEKKSEEIQEQTLLLNLWREYIEKMKNEITSRRKENFISIDNLIDKYSEDNNKLKKIIGVYYLLLNITKYRILNIENNKIIGYLLNAKNGNILNYNIKIKENESAESKATEVFNFWKALIDLNKTESNYYSDFHINQN